MLLDLVASHSHYYDHALPVWASLPEAVRGTNWGFGDVTHPVKPDRIIIAAGYSDTIRYPTRPVVYVEHGAGQSYVGLPLAVQPFYSGGPQHRNVIAYICPNEEVAARWSGRYDRPTFVVGCPKLDPWHSHLRNEYEPRTVAITFHWEPQASVWAEVPELRSAFETYCGVLAEAVDRWRADGWHVIAHAHPRAAYTRDFWFREFTPAVEFVVDSAEVLDRAAVLIADNTSLQAEFMSLGRPVVFLNHPSYRSAVDHSGRFWTWPRSLPQLHSIDRPIDLVRLNLDDLSRPTWHPFAYADGLASQRAAAGVVSLL